MRTPRQIVYDILDYLGVDDTSKKERSHLSKIIYRTQRDAFFEACQVCQLREHNTIALWYTTTRKHGLNGNQA